VGNLLHALGAIKDVSYFVQIMGWGGMWGHFRVLKILSSVEFSPVYFGFVSYSVVEPSSGDVEVLSGIGCDGLEVEGGTSGRRREKKKRQGIVGNRAVLA